jgi:hypothetical protein
MQYVSEHLWQFNFGLFAFSLVVGYRILRLRENKLGFFCAYFALTILILALVPDIESERYLDNIDARISLLVIQSLSLIALILGAIVGSVIGALHPRAPQ